MLRSYLRNRFNLNEYLIYYYIRFRGSRFFISRCNFIHQFTKDDKDYGKDHEVVDDKKLDKKEDKHEDRLRKRNQTDGKEKHHTLVFDKNNDKDNDHKYKDHKDKDHKDNDHKDRDDKDNDHKDKDHKDNDHKDRDHKDNDNKDKDHKYDDQLSSMDDDT